MAGRSEGPCKPRRCAARTSVRKSSTSRPYHFCGHFSSVPLLNRARTVNGYNFKTAFNMALSATVSGSRVKTACHPKAESAKLGR